MSDEEEVEKFEISDYDLATEFNPNRFQRKQTKKQAIYGVFAPNDSDDDDGGGGSRAGFGRRSKKEGQSYTSGIAFLSAGIQSTDKEKVKDGEQGDNDVGEEEQGERDSSSEDEFQVLAKSIGSRDQSRMGFGLGGRGTQGFGEIAGLRTNKKGHLGGSGGGKGSGLYGIGEKLALKMGYQPGKGLGKELQGISAPIEAVVRKGRGAIGAYGKETKQQPGLPFGEPPPDKISKDSQSQQQKWRKTGAEGSESLSVGSNRKEKIYKYLTADEVLEQKQLRVRPDAGFLAKTKVIDLTGPETRILSGYHAIGQQKRPEDDDFESSDFRQKPAFDVPELTHNINLLLDTCEQDILKNDKKGKYASDRLIVLQDEKTKLERIVQTQDLQVRNLESLIGQVEKLTVNNSTSLDLDSVFLTLANLKNDYEEEWEIYQLYSLIPGIVLPLIKQSMKSWNLLTHPRGPLKLFTDWKVILGNQSGPWETLIWEAWMPAFRFTYNSWNVKDADSMLNLLEIWESHLPRWIYGNILDQMILPKINEGVEAWDPLSDNIPIHAWIHPWLPLLGQKLEIVYPTIRRKLANALVHWDPSDVSGKQILTPWVRVFSKGSMDTFLLKNILPKLQLALQQLVINPNQQNLDQWKWVMDWQDIFPIPPMVNLLETTFFPKWHGFLIGWLNQRPAFDQVYTWYTWWRGIFPETLMRDPIVTENFQKALQMINASLQAPVHGQPMDFSYILSTSTRNQAPVHQPPPPQMTPELMADAIRLTSQVPTRFFDLVQMKCEEIGLIFVPLPNRYYEGKQVFKCGNVLVYISQNVIYIQREGSWVPTSLQQMIQAATN